MSTRFLALLGAVALLGPSPKNGEDVIREMHQRYAGKWYHTMTFAQQTTHEDGKIETWYEAAQIPGYLRIDIAPLDSMNAIIFREDSLYVFRGGHAAPARHYIHPLMVLGFDVYAESPEKTIEKLRNLKFDLSKLREDRWQGRAVYVVGADAGDTTTAQFWVDKERLLTVRLLQPGGNGGMESLFNKYQRLGSGWVSPEMIFYVNGKMMQKEEYSDIRADVTLPTELFDPVTYSKPAWIPVQH